MVKDLIGEFLARRRGSKYISRQKPAVFTATRHIIGPTGWQWSNAWNHLENDGDAYLQSFDPRVPASIHVSQRDRSRANQPVPLVERCIEDWENQPPGPHQSSDPAPDS